MRHYLYLLILMLFTFISCETEHSEDEWNKNSTIYYLSVDKQKIELSSCSGNEMVSVKINGNWSATSDVPWISLSPSSGQGDAKISINFSENTTVSDRSGIITIKSSQLDSIARVNVSQRGKYLNVEQDSLTFSNAGDTKMISFTAEGNLEVKSSETWITAKVSGSELSVAVEPNVGSTDRKGKVSLDITGLTSGKLSHELVILQTGTDYNFSVDKESIITSSSSAFSEQIVLSTNDDWTIESDMEWLAVSVSSGKGDADININVMENKTPEQRSGTITITGKYSEKSVSVSVTQAGKYLTVSPAMLSFGVSSSSKPIEISTDGVFSVKQEGNWFSVSSSGNILTVTTEKNSSVSTRCGSITVSLSDLESGSLSRTIDISQSGMSYFLGVSKGSISVGADAASETFNIMSNDSWTVSSDASWITLSPTSGSGDNDVMVSISTNSSFSKRTGTIIVKGTNSDTRMISVSQEGKIDSDGGGGTPSHTYNDPTISLSVTNSVAYGSMLSSLSINISLTKNDAGDFCPEGELKIYRPDGTLYKTNKFAVGSGGSVTIEPFADEDILDDMGNWKFVASVCYAAGSDESGIKANTILDNATTSVYVKMYYGNFDTNRPELSAANIKKLSSRNIFTTETFSLSVTRGLSIVFAYPKDLFYFQINSVSEEGVPATFWTLDWDPTNIRADVTDKLDGLNYYVYGRKAEDNFGTVSANITITKK